MQPTPSVPERRRRVAKLLREVTRAELLAIEHAARESRRLGQESPPAGALCAVAAHALAMQDRFTEMMHGHDLPIARASLGSTMSMLRDLVVDRVLQAERAYRTALLDLRHGIDMARQLRELARAEGLFGVIRWCDDWLFERRELVGHVEQQLVWFAELAEDSEDVVEESEEPR